MEGKVIHMGTLRSANHAVARSQLDTAFRPVMDILDKYFIEENKMNEVIEYALKMLVNTRGGMKPARIARKTIDAYKLKLLPIKTEVDE
jgi:hypothetical protein